MLNTSIKGQRQPKKPMKETAFKPELNQPNIKSVITQKVTKNNKSLSKAVQKGKPDPIALNKEPKKRSPPTNPERSVPAKRINMSHEVNILHGDTPKIGDTKTIEGITGDNKPDEEKMDEGSQTTPQPKMKPELNPELQYLRELLKADMEEMMIQPFKVRMLAIEESHKALEAKGELINAIKEENKQLRLDCDVVMRENQLLKSRLDKIENKLISSNVILHGIEDQAWELKEVTREKALNAVAHIANGKSASDRLDVVCKIGFHDIRCLGEYNLHRPRPIILEFEKLASAEFLLNNKKKLPKGIYADREYSEEVEKERRKLRPILCKAKQLPDYKAKSKLDGGALIIKGKSYTSKTLHLLLEPLTGYNVSSKISDTHIGFFGELNPFSNFHEVNFEILGMKFHSAEQFIQYQKAKLFMDTNSCNKIMQSKSALECKQLSKEIVNYDPNDWRE